MGQTGLKLLSLYHMLSFRRATAPTSARTKAPLVKTGKRIDHRIILTNLLKNRVIRRLFERVPQHTHVEFHECQRLRARAEQSSQRAPLILKTLQTLKSPKSPVTPRNPKPLNGRAAPPLARANENGGFRE